MTTRDDAIRKAVKLLKLSNSDNAGEAANAAAAAQEIIDRYELHADNLDADWRVDEEPEEGVRDYRNDPIHEGAKRVTWRFRLIRAIADANQSYPYWGGYGTGDIKIIGHPRDVSAVRYLYNTMVPQVDRLVRKHCEGNGRVYANNFRLGVVDTIARKLAERRKATEAGVRAQAAAMGNTNALVHVNRAIAKREERTNAVMAFVRTRGFVSSRASRPSYDYEARMAGRRAGEAISVGSRARGSLPG